MIGGVIKYFRFTWEQVLWEMSYRNVSMLLATIPSYEDNEKPTDKADYAQGVDDFNDFFKD